MPFDLIRSETTYQGRAFSVRRDEVRLPNGQNTHLDIVEHNGAVTILPLDHNGQIWCVRQYRYAAASDLIELPAGALEPNESPESCAQRELQEEIGMAAGVLEEIGGFFLAPGYSTEYMHIFLATTLFPAPLAGDEDEFLQVEQFPVQEVYRMAITGKIQDAKTLAALFLAQNSLHVKNLIDLSLPK